jgi:hypothetical protein
MPLASTERICYSNLGNIKEKFSLELQGGANLFPWGRAADFSSIYGAGKGGRREPGGTHLLEDESRWYLTPGT